MSQKEPTTDALDFVVRSDSLVVFARPLLMHVASKGNVSEPLLEFVDLVAKDLEKLNDIPIKVIYYLDGTRFFFKKDGPGAEKRLDIRPMAWEMRDYPSSEVGFTTGVRKRI